MSDPPTAEDQILSQSLIRERDRSYRKFRYAQARRAYGDAGFNKALEKAIPESAALAKKDNRFTIMEPDVDAALAKTIGRTYLTWSETARSASSPEETLDN
ncbi:MAG: hypothetical protein IPN19_01545 [Elusimicrobia bacterium]|nr:hypothetical protein [Elusimicrobiota bacterium]